jgi:hypothetical protein
MEKEYYRMHHEHTTNKEIHLIIDKDVFVICTAREIADKLKNFIFIHTGHNTLFAYEWVYNGCKTNIFYERMQKNLKEFSPEWSFESTTDEDGNIEIILRKYKPEVTIKRTVTIDT